jgi:hypothetical protein
LTLYVSYSPDRRFYRVAGLIETRVEAELARDAIGTSDQVSQGREQWVSIRTTDAPAEYGYITMSLDKMIGEYVTWEGES